MLLGTRLAWISGLSDNPIWWRLTSCFELGKWVRSSMATDRDNLMTQLRAEMLLEATKGLVLINGSGAVALATWLQSVWEKPWAVSMLWWRVSAMMVFGIGVGLAGIVPYVRYLASLNPNSTTPKKNPYWWIHLFVSLISSSCFAIAVMLIAIGCYRALPQSPVTAKPLPQTTVAPTRP
jgi:hypothetical protein